MEEKKKNVLFLDIPFHRKTGSSLFLFQLLESLYEVEICYIDLFKTNCWNALDHVSSREYEIIICWQVMLPMAELKRRLVFNYAVLFPMYDNVPSIQKPDKWYSFRGFQIISFSKTLDQQLRSIGFSSHYIQYFPKPIKCENLGDLNSVFFWNRHENININTVTKLLKGSPIQKVHIHKAIDPGNKFLEPNEAWCSYSFSTWYDKKEEMLKDMQAATFYMAPRKKEGIGMSFLEAMAMGRCVIAPNLATMNEYIEHGKTGYLYDVENLQCLTIKKSREMQNEVLHYMRAGYKKWEREKINILKWCTEPVKLSKLKLTKVMCIRFFKNPYKLVRSLR